MALAYTDGLGVNSIWNNLKIRLFVCRRRTSRSIDVNQTMVMIRQGL